MPRPAIATAADLADFLDAYNRRDWDRVFRYIADDCVWDACEMRMVGREEITHYWTEYHGAIEETLGAPEYVLFGDHIVYLQLAGRLVFIEDGEFYKRPYRKGDVVDLRFGDYYELDDDGRIKLALIYVKFPSPPSP